MAKEHRGERTKHPAQFPIALIDRIIKACSGKGDLVLDPFMGSGTTAEAAVANGRSVVGFEISADYIAVASERLDRFPADQREGVVSSEFIRPLPAHITLAALPPRPLETGMPAVR